MSGRDEFLALAERCETAVTPDNVLNRAIAHAVGWGYRTPSEAGRKSPAWFHPDDCRDGKPVLDSLRGTDVWREPSQYVFSVDSALTLLPKDARWTFDSHHGIATVHLYWTTSHSEDPGHESYVGEGYTPALALCAAALRAKAGAA